jgi:hypothetical protein
MYLDATLADSLTIYIDDADEWSLHGILLGQHDVRLNTVLATIELSCKEPLKFDVALPDTKLICN